MQYQDVDNVWHHVFDDSVYLCDTSTNTQDASMIGLVRELLGIPEGCPVKAVRNLVAYAQFLLPSYDDLIILTV